MQYMMLTFVEEHHYLWEGLHEVDVVIAVLLDLQEQHKLRLTLSAEHCQQRSIVLTKSTNIVTHWTPENSLIHKIHSNPIFNTNANCKSDTKPQIIANTKINICTKTKAGGIRITFLLLLIFSK